jgi:hypothetical protein
MKRLHISSLIVIGIGAVATFISSGAPAASSADDVHSAPSKEFACGAKEKPCPLQAWMKANMGPSSTEDPMPFDALAKNFKTIAAKSPGADFGNWSKLANDGAAAAGKKDAPGVKAACKACHDQYKKKFKEEARDIAFP